MFCECDVEVPWNSSRCHDSADERLCACTTGDASTEAKVMPLGERIVADPYVKRALDASSDPTCTTDVDAGGHPDVVALVRTATATLRRCGLVVIRNALDRSFMESFRVPFTEYARGLTNGTISVDGKTTHNEAFFIHKLSKKRWELLLPRSFASHELLGDEVLTSILSHFAILGPEYVLHSLGAAMSEAGSNDLHWHRDSAHPYATSGVAGADLPPHAATLLSPLLDVEPLHGRTEFCVGSHHLAGLTAPFAAVKDQKLESFLDSGACPPGLRKESPLLRVGDAIIFDYNTLHMAAGNDSPQLRSLLYLTFSRPWFKDTNNFDTAQADLRRRSGEPSEVGSAPVASAVGTPLDALPEHSRDELSRLTYRARFAQPYTVVPDHKHTAPAAAVLEDIADLFRPLSLAMKEQGFVLEDEDDEEGEEEGEEEEEVLVGEQECAAGSKDGQCAASPTSRDRCPLRTLFNTPMVTP